MKADTPRAQRVVSIFSGAGGLDVGLAQAGASTVAMCESWTPARRVLADHFPKLAVAPDVADFLPDMPYEILTAGFPCTDLSHAGGKAGIFGAQSGLVTHVFRIARETNPEWIVLENVPNLLHLHKGLGIKTVTSKLEEIGYRWAYRTLDSRFAGVPQRRNRVIVLASKVHDPAATLLGQDADEVVDDEEASTDRAWGFYWTEGRNGLGLIRGAIPTLKGGSTIGLPSAPAVWVPDQPVGRRLLLPSIEAGERLQGFVPGWTEPSSAVDERDMRWKLVGNAVTTGVAAWIGRRLNTESLTGIVRVGLTVAERDGWPDAAFGGPGQVAMESPASRWPERHPMTSLSSMVDATWTSLSHRATKGFLGRVEESGRVLPPDLHADLEEHLGATRRPVTATHSKASTSAEDRIRRELTDRGVDHLLDARPEPAISHRLDVVIPSGKTAIDIRSCFWHGCPDHIDARLASNSRWLAKRGRVVKRDQEMVDLLTAQGWFIAVAWAHDDARAVARNALDVASRRASLAASELRGGTLGHGIAIAAVDADSGQAVMDAETAANQTLASVSEIDEHRHPDPDGRLVEYVAAGRELDVAASI